LEDIRARKIDVIVVYKVDRLTRSLADFAKLVELFDSHGVSFVSVTQQFNTTTSMGRLTLNVLLSFAQFEREVTSERIRDKIAASKGKGIWVGGNLPLGYEMKDGKMFLREVCPRGTRDLGRISQEDVTRYVERHARDWSAGSGKAMCWSEPARSGQLRALHQAMEAREPADLSVCFAGAQGPRWL
jgi:DNA invertase Pin-like site-specific DNA recombinase